MASTCPVHQHRMLFDEAFFANPYPLYEQLHREGPIHRICLPDGTPAWLVTRFEDVKSALRDWRLVRNNRHAGPDFAAKLLPELLQSGNLVMEDSLIHTRLRRFVSFAFTPKRVDALRPRIEEVTDRLFAEIATRERVDLMSALAAPLPIEIISEILGIPHDRRDDVRAWSDGILGDDPQFARSSAESMLTCAREIIEVKKIEPGDDLITYWLDAKDDKGDGLSVQEMLGLTFVLLLGGQDTTVGMIGSGSLALLSHPELAHELRTHPELINAAVEELMRWDTSTHSGIRRFAMEEMEVGGVTIPKGGCVIASIGAANRDPGHFSDPEVIDFHREENDQLGFGSGVHICAGKELARLELRIAFSKLLQRFPAMTLAVDRAEIKWRPSYIIRVPHELPVYPRVATAALAGCGKRVLL